MDVSRNFFIGFDDAKSTRYYLMENWKDMGDFLDLFVSGVFMSQIGPTLLESINKPIFFLVFLEGVVYIYIFVYIVIRFYKLSKIDKTNKLVFVYAFLPAVLGIILIHYPFGIFNPGTAIRYKQSLVPLLIFFPMLMVYGRKITNEKY